MVFLKGSENRSALLGVEQKPFKYELTGIPGRYSSPSLSTRRTANASIPATLSPPIIRSRTALCRAFRYLNDQTRDFQIVFPDTTKAEKLNPQSRQEIVFDRLLAMRETVSDPSSWKASWSGE